jgi:23S rRNA (pseudouridine1915-N3)-methyltransferase
MLIRLIWVGRTRDPAAAGWIEEYRRRIVRHCPLEITVVRDAPGKGRSRTARESKALAGKLGGRGLVVVLDEGGKEMTSVEFARFLDKAIASGSAVSFLLGGPEGLDHELVALAGARISLSRLTLTHEMVRVVLMEQIYRAFSILKGAPYPR